MLLPDMKPCPFCGQKIEAVSWEQDGLGLTTLKVMCTCGVTIKIDADDVFRTVDKYFRPGLDALEKWNRRAGPETTDCPWK